jgi:hypothetical protein
MIDNPNPRNFYSENEMLDRQKYISTLKNQLLEKIKDLTTKIENEEPFPHGNMDLDFLSEVDGSIDSILNAWYY